MCQISINSMLWLTLIYVIQNKHPQCLKDGDMLLDTVNVTNYTTVYFYPPTKSEGYSFGVVRACVRPSIPSVRPSVRNYISVLIGQI